MLSLNLGPFPFWITRCYAGVCKMHAFEFQIWIFSINIVKTIYKLV